MITTRAPDGANKACKYYLVYINTQPALAVFKMYTCMYFGILVIQMQGEADT